MANICTTSYRITGTRKAVMDLYHVIQDLSQNEKKRLHLSELADYYSIEWQKKGISVRGTIIDYLLEEKTCEDYYLLSVETETAWSGCHELFHAIKDVLWDELSISYCEIEPGCDIFYVHDEADFFLEECVIDSDGKPFEECWCEPCNTIDEAINIWCEQTGNKRDGRTNEEMMNVIDSYEYEDENTFFYIHPLIRE